MLKLIHLVHIKLEILVFQNQKKELFLTEKEIKNLKDSSISDINKIAVEISSEVIKQVVNSELNKSNVSAIVEEISKKRIEKQL